MENFHSIKVTYIGATDKKPSRIRLETSRFKQYVVINYDYDFNSAKDIAINWLEKKGFEVVGTCEDGNMVITRTFKPLKEKKE